MMNHLLLHWGWCKYANHYQKSQYWTQPVDSLKLWSSHRKHYLIIWYFLPHFCELRWFMKWNRGWFEAVMLPLFFKEIGGHYIIIIDTDIVIFVCADVRTTYLNLLIFTSVHSKTEFHITRVSQALFGFICMNQYVIDI